MYCGSADLFPSTLRPVEVVFPALFPSDGAGPKLLVSARICITSSPDYVTGRLLLF
jgi:hypothetical protein